MRDPSFAPPASVLADSGIPNAVSPTGGMGLTLDPLGRVPLQASSAVPRCRVYNSANISIANNTATALTFDSERFDSEGIHDLTTNTGRLTCQTAGVYQLTACARWAVSAAGNLRAAWLRLNGATTIVLDTRAPLPGGALTANQVLTTLYQLAVGDYLEMLVQQDSGGALNLEAVGNISPEFGMVWVGPLVV